MVRLSLGLREIVSKQKRRWRDDAFDLDLTYVTDRIIAMGAPCEGVEAIYRNNADDVKSFLDSRHKGHYKVINLCTERESNPCFPVIERIPFRDHTPCALDRLATICRSIDEYLAEDPANVVAIHCKAGKGRTGLVISAYLLHCGLCTIAEDSLRWFGDRRTYDGKGVTIPSQIRYVHYYQRWMSGEALAGAVKLEKVRLVTVPSVRHLRSTTDVFVTVSVWKPDTQRFSRIFDSRRSSGGPKRCSLDERYVDVADVHEASVVLLGDVHVGLCVPRRHGHSGVREIASAWFNTRFTDEQNGVLHFSKTQADGACKARKSFPPDFELQVFVSRCAEESGDELARVSVESDCVSSSWGDDSDTCTPSSGSDEGECWTCACVG